MVAVIGIRRARPDSAVVSRVPASWSMMPATRKRQALYSAWTTRKATIATEAIVCGSDTSTIRVPSETTVE